MLCKHMAYTTLQHRRPAYRTACDILQHAVMKRPCGQPVKCKQMLLLCCGQGKLSASEVMLNQAHVGQVLGVQSNLFKVP